jgi:hypothetical protein
MRYASAKYDNNLRSFMTGSGLPKKRSRAQGELSAPVRARAG